MKLEKFFQTRVGDGGDGGGDGGGDDGGRISWPGPGPIPIAPRNQISRSGTSPHSDYYYIGVRGGV